MQIRTAPSFLILAVVLAVTQSATSHPIRTSKWVKTGEFEDPSARGIWKVFEKESFDQLPDPPHVTYNQKPAWQNNQNKEPTEQEIHSNRYVKGVSESGKPTVSVLIPKTMSGQMHNHHNQQTEEEKDHHSSDSSESKERAIHAIQALAAQRQDRYSEMLKSLHINHALNNKHKTSAPVSSSFSLLSDHSVSFFSYQFSFPTLRSKPVTSHHYQLPGVFPTIMVFLAMVWIAVFVVALVGFSNYLWELRGKALRGRGEEGNAGLEEKMKVPLRIVNAPSEWTRSQSAREHEYEFLGTVASDADSDSGSESDEDDYQIF